MASGAIKAVNCSYYIKASWSILWARERFGNGYMLKEPDEKE
jgi:hypothetical protein